MSYDIDLYIEVDTGSGEPYRCSPVDIGNYTSNVSPMWREALGYPLADLQRAVAGDRIADLHRAVADMIAHPDKYEAMNPQNGWGDYEGALDYLRRLLDGCSKHPKCRIYISH